MKDSKRVQLKSTSNRNYSCLIGKEGILSVGEDGLFRFQFTDDAGEQKVLRSGIVQALGSLEHPASKEVCFQTKNSTYVFEKTEREMGLWGAERNQLDSPPEISYEEYDSIRKTVEGLRRGDNQRLTLTEQNTVLKKWEKVNKDIKEGKTTIMPPKTLKRDGVER